MNRSCLFPKQYMRFPVLFQMRLKLFTSITIFMVWVIVNWGNVKGWLTKRTFKGFVFVEVIGRTFQAEAYEENSYGFGFVPGKNRVFMLE